MGSPALALPTCDHPRCSSDPDVWASVDGRPMRLCADHLTAATKAGRWVESDWHADLAGPAPTFPGRPTTVNPATDGWAVEETPCTTPTPAPKPTPTPRTRPTTATPASTPPTTSPGEPHAALKVAPPPPAPEPAPMPAHKPNPPPCRWPGCTSKAAGPHGYCNRDRMRITSSLKVDPRQFTPAQLAGLWAEHQGRSVGRPARTAPTPCKAPDCTRPAGGLGWCEPCRRMLTRMALAPETTTPEAFAEARAKRAAETAAKLATPKHHGLPVTTTWPEPAGKLREDLRRVLELGDSGSDDEIVARAEKLVADLAAQAIAASELAQAVDRKANEAQVLLFERDTLADRVKELEAELAALAVPMTEEELRLRGDALARSALDREWALARGPRVPRG